MTVRAKLKNFVHMWQFWTILQFWLIVTILNNCDNSEHFDNLYLLWQFLPLKTSDKRDFIIVKIVINSDNFDQFWIMWPIVTNDDCEQLQILWQIWSLVTNMSASVCHKCEQFWWLLGTSFEIEAISKPIKIYFKTFKFEVDKIHVASRGLSLTTCQSCLVQYCLSLTWVRLEIWSRSCVYKEYNWRSYRIENISTSQAQPRAILSMN